MVKMWYVDSLIDNQVERPPSLWVGISYHTTNGLVSLGAEGFIISHDSHWSVVVTFRLGGQLTFGIIYIHTESYTTFYVGI